MTASLLNFLIIALFSGFSIILAEIVNTDVKRAIDISFPVIKIVLDITATGVTSQGYNLVFAQDFADHISYITVKETSSDVNLVLREENDL